MSSGLINCALYCRLSREDGEGESSSISSQKEMLIEYARKHNFNIYDIYADDGYTGTNFNRPDFKRLIHDIELGKIQAVITKDLSRLGRNYLQTGYYTEEYFPLKNIRFIAINDNFDTTKGDNEFAPFKNIINEWYAKDISKKVRSTFDSKREKGLIPCGKLPMYGYLYNEKMDRVLNPETAPIVENIFKLYLDTMSTIKVKEYLTQNKIMTPAYYNYYKFKHNAVKYQNATDKDKYSWSIQQVNRILSNAQEYKGDLILKKSYSKSFKLKKRFTSTKEEILVFENRFESIITEDTYNKITKNLKLNTQRVVSLEENKYKGIVVCSNCEDVLRYRNFKNDKVRYICKNEKCDNHNHINKTLLDHIIKLELERIYETIIKKEKELLDYAANYMKIKTTGKTDDNKKILRNELENKNSKIEQLIQKLFEAKVSNEIPHSVYERMQKQYKEEFNINFNKINEINKYLKDEETRKINYEDLAKQFIENLKKVNINNIDRQTIVEIIDKIIVFTSNKEDMKIIVEYKYIPQLLENFMNEEFTEK